MIDMTLAVERRDSPRFHPGACGTDVQIRDWNGSRITRARLLNISIGGALICTDRVVATSQTVSMRLENAPETGWIEAEVVRFGRPSEVGIRFISPCRPLFVLAATSGPQPRLDDDTDDDATPFLGDVTPFIESRPYRC
jgi:hypothetical protein